MSVKNLHRVCKSINTHEWDFIDYGRDCKWEDRKRVVEIGEIVVNYVFTDWDGFMSDDYSIPLTEWKRDYAGETEPEFGNAYEGVREVTFEDELRWELEYEDNLVFDAEREIECLKDEVVELMQTSPSFLREKKFEGVVDSWEKRLCA